MQENEDKSAKNSLVDAQRRMHGSVVFVVTARTSQHVLGYNSSRHNDFQG